MIIRLLKYPVSNLNRNASMKFVQFLSPLLRPAKVSYNSNPSSTGPTLWHAIDTIELFITSGMFGRNNISENTRLDVIHQKLIESLVDRSGVAVNEYSQLFKTISELLLEVASDGCFGFVMTIPPNFFLDVVFRRRDERASVDLNSFDVGKHLQPPVNLRDFPYRLHPFIVKDFESSGTLVLVDYKKKRVVFELEAFKIALADDERGRKLSDRGADFSGSDLRIGRRLNHSKSSISFICHLTLMVSVILQKLRA